MGRWTKTTTKERKSFFRLLLNQPMTSARAERNQARGYHAVPSRPCSVSYMHIKFVHPTGFPCSRCLGTFDSACGIHPACKHTCKAITILNRRTKKKSFKKSFFSPCATHNHGPCLITIDDRKRQTRTAVPLNGRVISWSFFSCAQSFALRRIPVHGNRRSATFKTKHLQRAYIVQSKPYV